MNYTFTTWLFFFYFYCFLGWVWETCYVSVCQAKWVNRGFLHGPFLPIYGSGAIVVLLFTLPFRTNAILVFFVGIYYGCGNGAPVSCAVLGLQQQTA